MQLTYDLTASLKYDLLGNTVNAQNTKVFFTFPLTRLVFVTDGINVSHVLN